MRKLPLSARGAGRRLIGTLPKLELMARGRHRPTPPADADGVVGPPHTQGPAPAIRDRAALAAALDPIITINATGIIQSASDSVERVLGWKPAELIGRNVAVLMPEPHHSAHDGYLASYHQTGKTHILNRPRRFDAKRKDGSLVPIELCVSRAELAGGAAPLFVGIIRDMSAVAAEERSREEERIRAQQQLAEQTSALQHANARLRMADRMASIGTLAAGLGHDMNNVLLPVRARLNALKAAGESGRLPKADRSHVDEIQKSIAYLQQLADGLHFLALDPDTEEVARGGGGTTDLRQWWAQTGALLSKAVPKHVRVTATFAEDLPLASVAPHGLTQAVLNLVVNAGEAIPVSTNEQGHVRLSAGRSRANAGAWVELSVTDDGSGMTEEVKRRAFEMFFTTKPRGLGTGLGLALVRKVVDGAGGRVEIESDVGRGTTVRMIVPAAQPAKSGSMGRREAVIDLRDGRAAALIRHLLESSGLGVRSGTDPKGAAVWVTDPDPERLKSAQAWARGSPDGRLVLFGPPERQADAWNALNPVTISNPGDFESVRSSIGRAATRSQGRV